MNIKIVALMLVMTAMVAGGALYSKMGKNEPQTNHQTVATSAARELIQPSNETSPAPVESPIKKQTHLDSAVTKQQENVQSSEQINEPETSTNESLEEIKTLLVSMNERIEQLEQVNNRQSVVDGVYSENQQSESNALGAATGMIESEGGDSDNPQSAQAIQKQQKQQQYYATLEQVTSSQVDQTITQEVEFNYQDLISSREDWQQHVKLNSTQCGGEFCKIVVSYKLQEIDVESMFELDAHLIIANSDYPTSTSKTILHPDGTTEQTLYFAKDQSLLPAYPQ